MIKRYNPTLFLVLILLLISGMYSCSNELPETKEEVEEPYLLAFSLLQGLNPSQLIDDVEGTVVDDSIVECWIPYIIKDKKLKPSIVVTGDGLLLLDGALYNEDVVDFSKPVELSIVGERCEKTYKVYVHTYTSLPILWIETEKRAPIISKEEYINAHFRLEEGVVTRAPGDVIDKEIKIRGRGNHTWKVEPKKPYKVKFSEKVSLFDDPEDKTWALLANYYDKTMLRNALVFYLGRLSAIDYTPRSHFVELFLNGRYDGTYQLTENLKVSSNRVQGILLEVDRYATQEEDARYFNTPHLEFPVNIKDPDVEYDDETFNYVKDLVLKAENAIFSEDFTDPVKGWKAFFDVESLVDWYIITELAKDAEAIYMLCHMTIDNCGKINMGPLWDYDMCFGNYTSATYAGCEQPQGFWLKETPWFKRLFEDPYFSLKVKDRVAYFWQKKEDMLYYINNNASYLKYSASENNNRWNILYHPDQYYPREYDIWGSYDNEVQNLKQWFVDRIDWMYSAL